MREAVAEARREEDRKLLRKFLLDPEAYEAEVRAALAKTKERKRRFGHPKSEGPPSLGPPLVEPTKLNDIGYDYHLVVALVTGFLTFLKIFVNPTSRRV